VVIGVMVKIWAGLIFGRRVVVVFNAVGMCDAESSWGTAIPKLWNVPRGSRLDC